MADFGQIGQALSGFSAGVAGQLPQFQQGLRQDRQLRQEEQESARQRFIRGVGGATQMIRGGDLMGAVRLLDSIDDPNAQRAARELLAPQTSEETALDLFNLERLGILDGTIEGQEKGKDFTLGPGQTRFGAGGDVIAQGGAKPEGRDTLSQVQSSQILPNGSTVQVFRDGSTRVTGPQGRVLKGQERATAVEDAQEFGIDIQSRRAGGRAGATGIEQRASALITRGIAAAESTATVRRALDLLDRVKTGGIAAISIAMRQRLGIEGADEGELSNSLGKAVLSQLRETFGAAFTETEGDRLIRLEAALGKSPESNRRILGQALRIAERTANRAIKAARKRGNLAEVADIEDLLSFSLDFPDDQPAQQTPQQPAAGGFRILNIRDQ